MLTDGQLIARVLVDGDRSAFGELVRRYQSPVRGLLRRLCRGDAALADDLAQETFLRAYRGLGRYQGTARFSTWLYQIAYRTFLSEREKHGRMDTNTIPFVPASHGGSSSTDPHALERPALERALARLRPEEQTAILLTYAYDLPHEEAAVVLDCPLGTLKTWIARGKSKLRDLLGSNHKAGAA